MSDKDFLTEMQEEARLRFGAELSPAEAAHQFSLHGPEARIQHIKNIRTPDTLNLTDAGRRHAMERAIRITHEKLQKAGR